MKGKKKKKIIKRTKDKTALQIVKREGHTEIYDERKVYGSCFFACRNAHLSEKEAEEICKKVSAAITKWIKAKKVVSSGDIFKMMIQELKKHNEDAAFLYETHRDIS
ncbi:MAG: ATP cone domain-containing protein [Nanoarchaeota archaeon]|nr:ATP cone domain-containing protein [Nanoarchaeota archaeon]